MMDLNLLWPSPSWRGELCPSCNTRQDGAHDLVACERYQWSVRLEDAAFTLEDASGHLTTNQPLKLEDWDQDTREANRILTDAWLLVMRDQAMLEDVRPV